MTNAVAAAGENRWDPQRRLEELKERDPERYTQITNRMAQWRQRQFERAQSKLDFLSSVDTSRMSVGARKVHGDLQAAIVSQEELEQRLQDPNLTPDERKALFMEMHESRGRLAELSRKERNNLLGETARELGFSGEDVKTITATIRDVIEATDAGWGGHGHHGRGPGPRGAGGPPPGAMDLDEACAGHPGRCAVFAACDGGGHGDGAVRTGRRGTARLLSSGTCWEGRPSVSDAEVSHNA